MRLSCLHIYAHAHILLLESQDIVSVVSLVRVIEIYIYVLSCVLITTLRPKPSVPFPKLGLSGILSDSR
jgi:hypothetical protein